MDYPEALSNLIDELKRLPAIGPRSAERIALWLQMNKKRNPLSLAEALVNCERETGFCPECGFFSTQDHPCELCTSPKRIQNLLCVVESAPDVISLERSQAFRGLYHCLGGLLSPLDGIHPEDLSINTLLKRAKLLPADGEVILGIGAHVEGEATASYLSELLQQEGIKVSRLARGLPMGASLEFADQLTLARAFEGRKTNES